MNELLNKAAIIAYGEDKAREMIYKQKQELKDVVTDVTHRYIEDDKK